MGNPIIAVFISFFEGNAKQPAKHTQACIRELSPSTRAQFRFGNVGPSFLHHLQVSWGRLCLEVNMVNNVYKRFAALMLSLLLSVLAAVAQAPETAEAPPAPMMQNLYWMVPVAIVLVFLIRRRRKKRVKVED